jgi:hypothetical protein
MLSENAQLAESQVLKPIEHPPNHDGLDLSELPPMREAILSVDQIQSLFTDIEQLATDVLLMQHSSNSQRANVAKADTGNKLALAKHALLNGQLQKLQIRYRWQDSLWIDTLATQADGYRLVRIAHRN